MNAAWNPVRAPTWRFVRLIYTCHVNNICQEATHFRYLLLVSTCSGTPMKFLNSWTWRPVSPLLPLLPAWWPSCMPYTHTSFFGGCMSPTCDCAYQCYLSINYFIVLWDGVEITTCLNEQFPGPDCSIFSHHQWTTSIHCYKDGLDY